MLRSASSLAANLALIVLAAAAAAITIFINNGLAPPNPGNVIDSYFNASVEVLNMGCDQPA